MKKLVKVIGTMAMAVVLGVNMFGADAYAALASKTWKTSGNFSWNMILSSGTIGVNRYSLTSIATQLEKKEFASAYIDVELYSTGAENPYDENDLTEVKKISATVANTAGTISYGHGVSNMNAGDARYGYGGTTIYK